MKSDSNSKTGNEEISETKSQEPDTQITNTFHTLLPDLISLNELNDKILSYFKNNDNHSDSHAYVKITMREHIRI